MTSYTTCQHIFANSDNHRQF